MKGANKLSSSTCTHTYKDFDCRYIILPHYIKLLIEHLSTLMKINAKAVFTKITQPIHDVKRQTNSLIYGKRVNNTRE